MTFLRAAGQSPAIFIYGGFLSQMWLLYAQYVSTVCLCIWERLFEKKEQEPKDLPLSSSLTCYIFSKHTLEKNLQKKPKPNKRHKKDKKSRIFCPVLSPTLQNNLAETISKLILKSSLYFNMSLSHFSN